MFSILLVLLIIVLARPHSTHSWQRSEVEGIDIMMAVDISTSMLAEDLKPNRLEAAKQVAADFINGLIPVCLDNHFIMHMRYNRIIPQTQHGFTQQISCNSLHNIFHKLRTIGLDTVPFLCRMRFLFPMLQARAWMSCLAEMRIHSSNGCSS